MNRIHIAEVIPPPVYGGVGKCILNYFRHLDHSRFLIDVYLFEDIPADVRELVEAKGGCVSRLPKNPLKLMLAAYRAFRAGGYDIVHANWNLLNIFILFPAWLAGVKRRISHAHSASDISDFRRHCFKLMLRPFSHWFANGFLACSCVAGEFQFGKRTWDRGEVMLLHNAIELERFAFDAVARRGIRSSLGIPEEAFVIGHIGRLATPKNQAFLVRVFAEVMKSRPDSYLVFVGDGPDRRAIDAIIGSLARSSFPSLANRIVFTGAVDDANRYYSAFDVFAFPSFYEGLGMVLIEAQANGLKCVSSDGVPQEAKVTERVTFLPLSDPSAWVKELLSASSRSELSSSVSSDALSDYDVTAVASCLSDYLLR